MRKMANEAYLRRVLNVSKLAQKRKNHKWLKLLANQDKHRFTCIFNDYESLNVAKTELIEAADFIHYSARHIEKGISLPPEFHDTERILDKTKLCKDSKLLEMLICLRVEYTTKLIRELEVTVCRHLSARHGSAKIESSVDSEGKFNAKFSGKIIPTSVRLSIEIGVISHLLRSTLDHMVWALSVRNGKKPTTRNKFPIPEPDYQQNIRECIRNRMLRNLATKNVRKIEEMLNPLHPSMGNVYFNLLSLDSLRKTDGHRHVPVVISTLDGAHDDWYRRASIALDRRELPVGLTHDDVKFSIQFCDQEAVNLNMRYGGDVIQACYNFLSAVKLVGQYLDFDV